MYSFRKFYCNYEYRFWFTDIIFLISNFRRVLYVVCFLLGNSPAGNYPEENTQYDIIFFGLCPSSYFLMKCDFSEGGSASVFREVKHVICWTP